MKRNERKSKRVHFCELNEVDRRHAIRLFRMGTLESLITSCPENNKSNSMWCAKNLIIYESVDIISFFEDGSYEIFL